MTDTGDVYIICMYDIVCNMYNIMYLTVLYIHILYVRMYCTVSVLMCGKVLREDKCIYKNM